MNERTSQGLGQRLHDKGFRGEHESWLQLPREGKITPDNPIKFVPCYTFSELWGVLPYMIHSKLEPTNGFARDIYMWKDSKGITGVGYTNIGCIEAPNFEHESPAEAVGLLLEWLIDNNHMEVEG